LYCVYRLLLSEQVVRTKRLRPSAEVCGKKKSKLTTVFYFLQIGVLVSAPYTLISGSPPVAEDFFWLTGIGLFAFVQQVAKTTAYRMAEASVLAPYTYTAILWAVVTGWWFWDTLPSCEVMIGTAIVISCISYLLIVKRAYLPNKAS
jgi:drug/metabolite transporter (DMT)-like permease